LDFALDLFHRAADGNAFGGGSLSTKKGMSRSRVREAASPQQPALHLQVQL
jgi:hypothetical protein